MIDDPSPMACRLAAQPLAAEWVAEHPKWEFRAYRCELGKRWRIGAFAAECKSAAGFDADQRGKHLERNEIGGYRLGFIRTFGAAGQISPEMTSATRGKNSRPTPICTEIADEPRLGADPQ